MAEQELADRDWTNLLPELLSLILSRLLSVRDRCVFKSICKSWNTTTSIHVPLPPDSQFWTCPCLMIPDKNSTNSWKVFHSVYGDFYCQDLPQLKDAEIRHSNSGWLLLTRGHDVFFFDPIRRVKIDLPPMTEYTFVSLCFSCPPTSPGCLVFGILNTGDPCLTIFVFLNFGRGIEYWEEHRYGNNPPENCLARNNYPPVFLNGVFYGLNRFGDVLVADLAAWDPFKYYYGCHSNSPGIGGHEFQQSYMAQVEGEIWGVLVDDEQVFVVKLDLEGMLWKPLESLGDKCLFVGSNGSFSDTACPETGLANKIFFESGVLYSVTSGKYHPIGCIETSFNTTWIKPRKPLISESLTTSDWLDWI